MQMSVVKLIILDESESFAPAQMGSESRISASDMLKAFCKWQSKINEFADKKDGYDVALLLTR